MGFASSFTNLAIGDEMFEIWFSKVFLRLYAEEVAGKCLDYESLLCVYILTTNGVQLFKDSKQQITQIINTDIFSFLVVLVFKLLSHKLWI